MLLKRSQNSVSFINWKTWRFNCSNMQDIGTIVLQDDYLTGCLLPYKFYVFGTDRSQQTVQTKIRLLLKKQSDQDLRCLPFYQHLLDALMQCYIKLFLFLGQLWSLFEVSQILEFLRYYQYIIMQSYIRCCVLW